MKIDLNAHPNPFKWILFALDSKKKIYARRKFLTGWSADTVDDHWFLITDDGDEWRLSALRVDGCPYAANSCPIQESTKHSYEYILTFAKKFRTVREQQLSNYFLC